MYLVSVIVCLNVNVNPGDLSGVSRDGCVIYEGRPVRGGGMDTLSFTHFLI